VPEESAAARLSKLKARNRTGRRTFTTVGLIYTGSPDPNLMIYKTNAGSRAPYVARPVDACVGDFDSRRRRADV